MATNVKPSGKLQSFCAEIRARANAQINSPETKRLLETPMTRKGANLQSLQRVHFTTNRRDCWAFTQALAPMDVKKFIWEHEEDELAGNKARGMPDHHTLQIKQGALLDLTPEMFANVPMLPGTRACVYAWTYLVTRGPWQKSLGACAALELGNSSDWVEGGGISYRFGKKLEAEMGIPFDKQINAKEHAEVDVDHGHMLIKIAEIYNSPSDLALMMEGLVESWDIERVWRGVLADMLSAI